MIVIQLCNKSCHVSKKKEHNRTNKQLFSNHFVYHFTNSQGEQFLLIAHLSIFECLFRVFVAKISPMNREVMLIKWPVNAYVSV